jgi:hypothetical protein
MCEELGQRLQLRCIARGEETVAHAEYLAEQERGFARSGNVFFDQSDQILLSAWIEREGRSVFTSNRLHSTKMARMSAIY